MQFFQLFLPVELERGLSGEPIGWSCELSWRVSFLFLNSETVLEMTHVPSN